MRKGSSEVRKAPIPYPVQHGTLRAPMCWSWSPDIHVRIKLVPSDILFLNLKSDNDDIHNLLVKTPMGKTLSFALLRYLVNIFPSPPK